MSPPMPYLLKMTTNINKIEINNQQIILISLAFVLIVVLVFALAHISKYINSLSKNEKKELISNWFMNIKVTDSILAVVETILSGFIYTERAKIRVSKKTKITGDSEPKQKLINNYLEEEYSSAKTTRMIFINLFFISTIAVIFGFIWLDKLTYEVRITIGCLYFGLSLFVLFVIKSCYSRTAVILSILEDQEKKNDIRDFIIKYKKSSDLNDHDIELIKTISISRAEREKSTKHPYEIILKNISGSSLSFGNGKINIGEEDKKKGSKE